MALPVRQQLLYWGIASAVFLILLWALGNVMLPFLVGGAIAYFLDPVADRLERAGLSRVGATVTISLVALLIAVLLILAIIPTLTTAPCMGLLSLATGSGEMGRRSSGSGSTRRSLPTRTAISTRRGTPTATRI